MWYTVNDTLFYLHAKCGDYRGMVHIGLIIKKFRERAGMTQKEFAAACGWDDDGDSSQRRVSNYERKLREPKISDLEAMAKALGVSVADFFTDPDSDTAALSDEEYRAGIESLSDKELAELLRITADRLSS